MTIQELQNKNLKHGIYHKAQWQSIKSINGNEYKKVSNGIVRVVKYSNLKVVKAKLSEQAPKTESKTQWLIEDLLFFNENTKNYLVRLGTTNHKAKSKYYVNGNEVSKEDFENVVKPNGGNQPVFSVKLENLISIE